MFAPVFLAVYFSFFCYLLLLFFVTFASVFLVAFASAFFVTLAFLFMWLRYYYFFVYVLTCGLELCSSFMYLWSCNFVCLRDCGLDVFCVYVLAVLMVFCVCVFVRGFCVCVLMTLRLFVLNLRACFVDACSGFFSCLLRLFFAVCFCFFSLRLLLFF